MPLPFANVFVILTILIYPGKILFSYLFVFILLLSSTPRTNPLLVLIAPHLPIFFFSSTGGTRIKPLEARSLAVPEARAFPHGSRQWGPGWRAPSPLQYPNPSPCSPQMVSEGASTGESPYSCHHRCAGWQMAVRVHAWLKKTEVGH